MPSPRKLRRPDRRHSSRNSASTITQEYTTRLYTFLSSFTLHVQARILCSNISLQSRPTPFWSGWISSFKDKVICHPNIANISWKTELSSSSLQPAFYFSWSMSCASTDQFQRLEGALGTFSANCWVSSFYPYAYESFPQLRKNYLYHLDSRVANLSGSVQTQENNFGRQTTTQAETGVMPSLLSTVLAESSISVLRTPVRL